MDASVAGSERPDPMSPDAGDLPFASEPQVARSLDDLCLGHGLPAPAEVELARAAAAYADESAALGHLLRALALASEHPATHIGLYRFYFYRNRLVEALSAGIACLEFAARLNGLPADWRAVRGDQAEFGGYAALPRFYLFTLKACAYLEMRLGLPARGAERLTKLAELDPADRLGGSVLRGVIARMGCEDD